MQPAKQTIDALIKEFCDYLDKIHRSKSTIRLYCYKWGQVKAFMALKSIKFYDQSVGKQFLQSILGDFNYDHLTNYERNLVNRVEALAEFQDTGRILGGMRSRPPRTFEGAIGVTMTSYMNYRQSLFGLSKITITSYIIYLHDLLMFLNKKAINSFSEITPSVIISFINSIDHEKAAAKHVALLILKGYFKYLHEQHFLVADYSLIIPKTNYKNQPHLPSTFTNDEIGVLLNAIDRSSPKGKRDYAILLLATKLGLRSSDIRALRFEYILWEYNLITFKQIKTVKPISLPLLAEIGNAIIDYLKHGRPVSQDPYCFLQVQTPHTQMHKSAIGNLVAFYLKRTGINCKNRRHGPHALRHSFAANLLSEKIPLPVISEALGHGNTNSTMYYLSIDVTSLKQCALDVPLVPLSFYNQKGGLSHV
jgi:site-specific recombinase XerD